MSTIIGSYSLDVPATAAWTIGPTFKRGELVRVVAGGSVRWKRTSSGGGDSLPDHDRSWNFGCTQSQPGDVPWAITSGGPGLASASLPPTKTSYWLRPAAASQATGGTIPDGATVTGVQLDFILSASAESSGGSFTGYTPTYGYENTAPGLPVWHSVVGSTDTPIATGYTQNPAFQPTVNPALKGVDAAYCYFLASGAQGNGADFQLGQFDAPANSAYPANSTVRVRVKAPSGSGIAIVTQYGGSMNGAADPPISYTATGDWQEIDHPIKRAMTDAATQLYLAVSPAATGTTYLDQVALRKTNAPVAEGANQADTSAVATDAPIADGDLTAVFDATFGVSQIGSTGVVPVAGGSSTVTLGGPGETFGRTWTAANASSLGWDARGFNSLTSGTNRTLALLGVNATFYVSGGETFSYSYALPEGAYPSDFPEVHLYEPGAVLQADAWPGSALVASGRPPLSLAMLILPDGQTPPFAATSGCLSPLRRGTYDAETGLGATEPNLFYRLWFVVNDGLGDFSDDQGGYSVLIERIRTTTMSLPLESLVSPRFGLQTGVGVRSDVFRMLGCIADKGFKPKPDQQWEESGTAGFGYQTDSNLIYDVSNGDVTLNLDTLDTGYVLYSVFGGEKVTTLAPGVYKHDFEFDVFTQAIAPAYSAQTPTEAGEIAQAMMDLIFNGFKLSADPGKLPTASSAFIAGKLNLTGDADMPTLSSGVSAVQVVSVNGNPTSGTFVLLDHTKASGIVNTTDVASAVQTAVRLLGNDYANATVAGSAGAWTITSPTGKRLAPLVPDYTDAGNQSTLVGGTAPTVTVAVTNPGGFKINPVARCGAQSWCVKVAPTWTAMENAPIVMTDNWSSNVTIGERYVRKWIQGCSPGAFTYNQKDGKDIVDTMELEMALVDPVRTFLSAARSGQRLCARLLSTGAQIGATAYKRSMTIDMDGQAKWPDNTDSDNVRSVKIDFRALYNIASGQMLRISLVNELASYATN